MSSFSSTDPLRFGDGDIIEMEIDGKQSKLTVRNTTQNLADAMDLPAGKQWHLYVVMYYGGTCTSVRILDIKQIWTLR